MAKPSPKTGSPEVSIVLDKPRRLRVDLNAMIALEEALGITLAERPDVPDQQEANNRALGSLRGVRAMLWAALIHEDSVLTLEQAGALIHPGNMRAIGELVPRAWGMAEEVSSNVGRSAEHDGGHQRVHQPVCKRDEPGS